MVVEKTQDLLLEGGVRAHTGGLRMVGVPHEAFPGVWVGASRQGWSDPDELVSS